VRIEPAKADRDKDRVAYAPLITIIVSVLNGAGTLQRCIDSVTRQTYPHRELVIVDGGSTDASAEIMQKNNAQLGFWLSEPDRGIYDAWNKGLLHARGEWICFLGVDDYFWSNDVLERMVPQLNEVTPAISLVYGQVAVVNRNGEEVSRVGPSWASARTVLPQIMCIPHTGLMHHRSIFERWGNFDPSFRIAGDYEFLLRFLPKEDAFFVPGLVVAGMGHGGVSSDPAGSLRMLLEFRRAQLMHGGGSPGRHWVIAYAKAHIRVWLWRMLGRRLAPYLFDFGRIASGKRAYWTRQ
jgi:glycosyltransferase involved in cell wall biosynthesis